MNNWTGLQLDISLLNTKYCSAYSPAASVLNIPSRPELSYPTIEIYHENNLQQYNVILGMVVYLLLVFTNHHTVYKIEQGKRLPRWDELMLI